MTDPRIDLIRQALARYAGLRVNGAHLYGVIEGILLSVPCQEEGCDESLVQVIHATSVRLSKRVAELEQRLQAETAHAAELEATNDALERSLRAVETRHADDRRELERLRSQQLQLFEDAEIGRLVRSMPALGVLERMEPSETHWAEWRYARAGGVWHFGKTADGALRAAGVSADDDRALPRMPEDKGTA